MPSDQTSVPNSGLPGFVPRLQGFLLKLKPRSLPRLRSGNELLAESLGVPFPPNTVIPTTDYLDSFGNRCARFLSPAGHLRLSGSNIIEAESFPDVQYPDAEQMPIEDLPSEVLRFLLPPRQLFACSTVAAGGTDFPYLLLVQVRVGMLFSMAIHQGWLHHVLRFGKNLEVAKA
jgi:hypothetical protein